MLISEESLNFLSIIGICSAVVGILILLIVPKSDKTRLRPLGLGLFVGGAFLIVYSFLFLNPEFLSDLRDHLALVLIGLVIATLSVIRILKKWGVFMCQKKKVIMGDLEELKI